MPETCPAFEKRGVASFYNSLDPAAKKYRWAKEKLKSLTEKTKINEKTVRR